MREYSYRRARESDTNQLLFGFTNNRIIDDRTCNMNESRMNLTVTLK